MRYFTKFCLLFSLFIPMLGYAQAEEASLRVMAYNIRNGKAKDGANHWDKRKDLSLGPVKAFKPDLLGLQEAYEFQNTHFAVAFPNMPVWEWVATRGI